MSEDKTQNTEEQVETTDGQQEDDTTKGSEVSTETLEVQKRKALDQRDEARKEKEELQTKLDELEAKPEKVVSPEKTQSDKTDNSEITQVKADIQRLAFAQAHPEIEPGDIGEIIQLAKMNNKTLDEALELPMMVAYLEKKANDNKVAAATANSTRSSKSESGKPTSEMTDDEKKEDRKLKWDKAVSGTL